MCNKLIRWPCKVVIVPAITSSYLSIIILEIWRLVELEVNISMYAEHLSNALADSMNLTACSFPCSSVPLEVESFITS